jgi:TRAP-type transport system periplasmic protein
MPRAEVRASEKLGKGLKDLGQVAFSLTSKKERSGAMKKTELPKRKETCAVDRREFMRLAAMFGTTAALGGMLAAPSFATARELREVIVAQAAKGKEKVAAAAKKMILSIDGVSNRWPEGPICKGSMYCLGIWELKEAIERNSKGAIFVEIVEGGALGSQIAAAKKVQQEVMPACTCSSQNMAALVPVWNVLDFPYIIGPVPNFWKLAYSKEVNDTLRAKSMEQGMIALTFFPQPRWLELKKGLPQEIRRPELLKGLKIRVTGSKLEQEDFKILPSNPTPIAWSEVYTSMKEGAVDGVHVGPASVADFSIHEVVGQLVDTEFMYNADTIWVGTKWYRNLPATLQGAIMEAAYEGQVFIHDNFEPLHVRQVGVRPNSPPDAIWKKVDAKQIFLTVEERKAWEDYLSFERNKDRFEPLVAQFGKREFEMVRRVANAAGGAEKRRWWKA